MGRWAELNDALSKTYCHFGSKKKLGSEAFDTVALDRYFRWCFYSWCFIIIGMKDNIF